MTTVIPSSINNIALTPGTPFTTRKNECLKRCNLPKNSARQTWSSHKHLLPLSTSVGLFPQVRSGFSLQHKLRAPIVTATGTDLAVQETEAPTADDDSGRSSETPDNVGGSEVSSVTSADSTTPIQKKRPKPARKSDMPPVKPEELVPGATFTGKVKSIQPFGAFVDFGAFTDGLVHVSRLSDTFVKDVGNVVSVGQEVQVRLVEANTETGRISLTMRESDDITKLQQKTDAPASGDKARPARKSTPRNNQKTTKFAKGQDLQGTVKNLARSGAFISLPEGEEGFLPNSEEVDEGFVSMMGGSSLEVGQEISVRVLRITRGQVTLTMKKEEDVKSLDSKLSQGVVHGATNPFLLAFRKNKDIAAFLDEREKEAEPAVSSISQNTDGKVSETEAALVETSSEEVVTEATTIEQASEEIVGDTKSSETISETALAVDEVDSNGDIDIPEQPNNQALSDNQVTSEVAEITTSDSLQSVDNAAGIIEEITSGSEEISRGDELERDVPISESVTSEEVTASETDEAITKEEKLVATPSETEVVSSKAAEDEKTETNADNNGIVTSSNVETPVVEQNKTQAAVSPALVKQLREETGAGMMDCKKALLETGGDLIKAQEFLRKKGLASADKKSGRVTAEGRIGSYIHDSRIGILVEVNCETDFVSRGDIFKELVDDLAMQVAACPQVAYIVTDDVPKELIEKEKEIEMQKEDLMSKPEQIRSKIVEGRIRKRLEELALLEQPYIKNDKMVVKDWVKNTIATIGENIKVKRFVRFNLGEGLEKKSQDFAAEVAAQTAAKPVPAPSKDQPTVAEVTATVDTPPKAAISAGLVKQLREETGAGMMDCKKALAETGGDLEKAQEYLRKKGLSAADKKSSRLAAEGRIGSYIHDARIGVLIEVNCETDFVGRGEQFKELVDDLAMQVAACPQVQYVSIEDIPESIVSTEKALEMQREDLLSKPENIREKIVEGRISKRLGELALLEQPFIKNDSILVKDLIKQTVAALGENIKVRRFVRFTLGEASESPEREVEA